MVGARLKGPLRSKLHLASTGFGALEALQTWKVHLHRLRQSRRSPGESWELAILTSSMTNIQSAEKVGERVSSCDGFGESMRGHLTARLVGQEAPPLLL